MSCADTEIGRSGRSQSEPCNKRLIAADTVYGLLQSANDLMRERFTSKGRTLDDNSWRGCPTESLEVGFWKAVRDRDFGSVLTYSAMLAGRGVNVADLIGNNIHASSHREITHLDTIRLQRTTIGQHEKTIADLRAKLDGKETPTPQPYQHFIGGMALESERIPELCYSVEAVCDNTVETLTIQGDPAAVKDLVMIIRAEKAACDGPMIHNVVIRNPDVASEIAAAVAEAYKQVW